ncbi:hypothetical protein YSA_10436 [Pseudomonas putida ND6]|uniref:Uncharacterized protein n=1 Tax=Pseudomonas putida ND6 TaxID=231023 RepID=I3V3V7_PSEPU|nr:hypothetical protein YSA_10436 [Pseudomonas putida ND6]
MDAFAQGAWACDETPQSQRDMNMSSTDIFDGGACVR